VTRLAALLVFFSLTLNAQDSVKRLRILSGFESTSFTGAGGTASGGGLALGLNYAIAERFALGTAVTQSFGLSRGFTPLFSRIEISASWALTGRMTKSLGALSVDSQPLIQMTPDPMGSLRLKLKGNQYFFTGSSTVLPYAGFGAELSYEWAASEDMSYEVALGVDRLSNTLEYIYPVRACFFVVFWR
jgi:hypothetical protein